MSMFTLANSCLTTSFMVQGWQAAAVAQGGTGWRLAERRYPTSKVRSSGHEEIPHVQGKRNPSRTVGAERGHQMADRLKTTSTEN